MQTPNPRGTTRPAPRVGARSKPVPLSVLHADALWKPRPPIGFDDEGYPFESVNVSESSTHDDVLHHLRGAAEVLLGRVDGNMLQRNHLILFEEGNPRAAVEPDITVSLGVGKHHRNSYKLWVEGKAPDLVVEGLSEKTWRKDLDVKPALYQDMGVREYWVLDPVGRTPDPIVGFHLRDRAYEPISPDAAGGYLSEVLQAILYYDRRTLRVFDIAKGDFVPTQQDAVEQRDEAVKQRQALEEERRALYARIAELEGRPRS